VILTLLSFEMKLLINDTLRASFHILSSSKAMQKKVYLIGSIGVSGKTKWDVLDGVIRRLFKVPV